MQQTNSHLVIIHVRGEDCRYSWTAICLSVIV